jgi:uncharacterized membrane protein
VADVVAQSIDIEAPIERVWEVVMDPELLGDWVTIHDSVSEVPAGDLKKGSRFKQAMKLKGVPLKVRWEVVECKAPEQATWNGEAAAGAKAQIVYALSEKDGVTIFDYQNEFELPAGKVGKLAAKAFNAMSGDREAKKSLKNLKELIENGNG